MSLPPVVIPKEDCPLDHPALPVMLELLGCGPAQAVKRWARFPGGRSYWNVQKRIGANGGGAVYGWLLFSWPGVYVGAIHHAVWRDSAGALLDVTAPWGHTAPGETTSFVPDARFVPDLAWPVLVPHRYVKLIAAPMLDDVLQAYNAFHQAEVALLQAYRMAGFTWSPTKGFVQPARPALMGPVQNGQRRCNELSQALGTRQQMLLLQLTGTPFMAPPPGLPANT